MNQNGVVCQPGPALLFFIFQFEYFISGPKSYRDFRETGPTAGYRGKTFPCVHEELNTLKSEATKSSRHASLQKRRHVFYYSVLKCNLRVKLRQMIKTLTETECLLKLNQRDQDSRLRQTANLRFKLRISQNRKQANKNSPENFLRIKLA